MTALDTEIEFVSTETVEEIGRGAEADFADDLLIEEVSIDGMCGVY